MQCCSVCVSCRNCKELDLLMTKKKILFIVNGFGLGNSTRCDAVIQNLVRLDYSVDVASSLNGLSYFSEKEKCSNTYSIKPFSYKSSKGKINFFKTFFSVPAQLFSLFQNAMQIRRVIKKEVYLTIVIDSEYSVALLRPFLKIPIVSINNANVVIEEYRKLDSVPRKLYLQLVIEFLDELFQRTVANLRIAPAIDKYVSSENIVFVPPIVREHDKKYIPSDIKTKNIVIMFSGAQIKHDTNFIKGLVKFSDYKFYYISDDTSFSTNYLEVIQRTALNLATISNADILIINGGFSSISEAVIFKKPAIILPIEGHAEQFINAIVFERNGFGLIAHRENILEKLEELVMKFEDFSKAHSLNQRPSNGAMLAAQEIVSFVDGFIYK